MAQLRVSGVSWPEVRPGDDLAELLLASTRLADGDVVVVTSKVVSKAEGRVRTGDRRDLVHEETRRVVARRADSVIAETRLGLVMAAAGVDASNTQPGTALLLPADPDASARRVREAVLARAGVNIAIVVSDTAGRAWRHGQIDLAVGCAGMAPLVELRGATDPYGNVLTVTAPALADEIASAGDLVKGKTSGRPVAVIRGLGSLVLPAGDNGPGAAALIRDSATDLFGLGSREAAVAAAMRDDSAALDSFPPLLDVDPLPFASVVSTDPAVLVTATPDGNGLSDPGAPAGGWTVLVAVRDDASTESWLEAGRLTERCAVIAAAHRLRARRDDSSPADAAPPGWRAASATRWGIA